MCPVTGQLCCLALCPTITLVLLASSQCLSSDFVHPRPTSSQYLYSHLQVSSHASLAQGRTAGLCGTK